MTGTPPQNVFYVLESRNLQLQAKMCKLSLFNFSATSMAIELSAKQNKRLRKYVHHHVDRIDVHSKSSLYLLRFRL